MMQRRQHFTDLFRQQPNRPNDLSVGQVQAASQDQVGLNFRE